VVLHGRNVPKLEAVYDEIEADGGPRPAILPLDYLAAKQADLDGFAQAISDAFGRLDGIFHAATHFSPLMALGMQDLDTWQKHMTVNVSTPAALTRACLPMLNRAGDASVVFLTETHALAPTAYWGAFAVAKSSLNTLVAIWAAETALTPALRFRVCLPGPVDSPVRAKSHPGESSAALATMDSMAPHFVYLLGPDSLANREIIYRCADPEVVIGDAVTRGA
jgi:NAD(P)-dependent dehydrogenase (short-subunit alcohol dehydrogenase family)